MQETYGPFAALYDKLMADVDYAAWADYLATFLPPKASVAECACGTGEITLRLARKGFRMIGLDISPAMLDVAGQKARRYGQRIPFICQDMRSLALHRPVQAILCPCDGVNYLTRPEDAAAFFAAAHRALEEGGQLLFDISSAYKLSQVLGCNTFAQDAGDCAYIWQNIYDGESRLVEMELTFFQREGDGRYRRFTERHIQRAHGAEELLALLEAAGFQAAAYSAFTREPIGQQDERIQFVAKKLCRTGT